MLTYPMDERGGLPLYEYLCRRIRTDILSGAIAADERLPSKRTLAEHLGVSVITVEGAYAQLEAEGYVYALAKRGFFAARVERTPCAPAAAPPRSSAAPVPEIKLDLRRGQMDASRFPVSVWARLTRQVLSDGGSALLDAAPHNGLPALRQAIAEDLRERKGMTVFPDQIAVGAGAEYLYILLAQLLGGGVTSGREPILAVEDPGYPKIRLVYEKCGVRCRPVPLDAQGIELHALHTSGANALHLSPSHHYPTGLVTPIARRQALLRWAEDTGGIIIEDDYDSEFRFTGRPLPTLQSIDTGGRVIYMNTFSQTIAPSMRVGFMVLPLRLLERYRRELGFYACTVPSLDQHVLARFISGGYYDQHLSRMRKEYRARRAGVLEAFRSSSFADRIVISEQGAGLHFLLRLDTSCSDDALRERAEALGVRLGFLSEYAAVPLPDHAHTLVVNYAGLEPARLPAAMTLLAQVFAV